MRVDLKVAILLALAGLAGGMALMAVPSYFEIPHEYAGLLVFGGLGIAVFLLGWASIVAYLGEKDAPAKGHARRMIALPGMIIFGLGFLICSALYFWPVRSLAASL